MNSRPLRVAFLSGLTDKKLAQKLAPLQSMPEVAAIDLYRRQPFQGAKVRWIPIPKLGNRIKVVGDLWRFLMLLANASRYDVLIGCHQRFHGVYAALAGWLRKRPVIQLTITDPAWMQRIFLGDWALRQASAVGFRGQTTLRRFQARYGSERPLFVLHNQWNPPVTSPREKCFDLIYVGNLQGYKNIPAWLRTAAEIKRRRRQLRAVLIGDLPNKSLTTLAKQLGIWNDLEFTGPVYGEALYEYYAQARVLLLTSTWEGLPMVAVEALAIGVPVVATDVGDTADLVKHGHNGFLTQVGDITTAADCIEKLLDDNGMYENMAAEAKRSVQSLLAQSTLEETVSGWRSVFRELGLTHHDQTHGSAASSISNPPVS